MKCSKIPVLFLLVNLGRSLTAPLSSETQQFSEDDWNQSRTYLRRFFNMTEPKSRTANTEMTKKIREMQEFFGLQVTGNLNQETLDVMKKSRCGVPDVQPRFSFFPGEPRWHHNRISYRILNYTPDLTRQDVDTAIAMAFKIWSDVTPLTFVKQTRGEADIMILFARGDHGDLYPFDGPFGAVAHAFAPGPGKGGDSHFDEDERWTLSEEGINLFLVAAHEFGHALGLAHSNDESALMYPVYSYFNTEGYRLPADDVIGIQALYGARTDSKPAEPQPNLDKPGDGCNHRSFDAITTLRGELWFFKNGNIWRKHPQRSDVTSIPIKDLFPNIQAVDAAFELKDQDLAIFFEGSKYWLIRGHNTLKRYPQSIRFFGFPRSVTRIDAAVYINERKRALFFVGQKYWSYDVRRNQMESGYPRRIKDDFPGIGNKVDSAFQNSSHLYLSNGPVQYEFDYMNKQVIHGLKTSSWLNCD